MNMLLHHQNLMLGLREQMGWPTFKPANDCIGWSSGKTMNFEAGMELGRIARLLGKDMVYAGWADIKATEPVGFSVAYREMLTIDIVDRVVPYAANDEVPIVLVSIRSDDVFAVDARGTLARMTGKPKAIGRGRKLAMKRIRAAAAARSADLLKNNRWVPPGATSIEPEASTDVIIRFA